MYSYLTEREWNVPRSYSDFYELYVVLSRHHLDVPAIPDRSIGEVTNISELNKRKESLNNFTKSQIHGNHQNSYQKYKKHFLLNKNL
jgi:hypothetical protein